MIESVISYRTDLKSVCFQVDLAPVTSLDAVNLHLDAKF